MFDIEINANETVTMAGRFDASQVEKARSVLLNLPAGKTVDLSRLEYISSAGLGILLAAQKRLAKNGHALKLVNVNSHIRDVFHYSGFDQLFEIG